MTAGSEVKEECNICRGMTAGSEVKEYASGMRQLSWEECSFLMSCLLQHQVPFRFSLNGDRRRLGAQPAPLLWIESLTLPGRMSESPNKAGSPSVVISSLTMTCDQEADNSFQRAIVSIQPSSLSDSNQAVNATPISPSRPDPSLRSAVIALSSLGLSGAIQLGRGVAVASFATGWPSNPSEVGRS